MAHEHSWREGEVRPYKGEPHPAVTCDGEGECPLTGGEGETGWVDLILNEDPRQKEE